MSLVLRGIKDQFLYYYQRLGNPIIRTLYIGGGTPNCLPQEMLEELLSWFAPYASSRCEEWTVEINPEQTTADHVQILSDSPVNRLSVGVQSFEERLLKALSRNAGLAETLRGLEHVFSLWNRRVNMDLITSIPSQSKAKAVSDVRKAASYKPGHISCYSLTLEEGVPAFTRYRDKPENISAWEASVAALEKAGYKRYEISNFCKPGEKSLHNMAYWRMKPYLGIGPGAASTLPGKEGILRIQNTKNLEIYLANAEGGWGASFEEVGHKDFLFEYCMMGLRLSEGIDLAAFTGVFGAPPLQFFPKTIQKWRVHRLAAYGLTFLSLTARGKDILNPMLRDLLAELDGCPEIDAPSII